MANKIHEAAKNYKKAVHGEVTLEHAVKYLESIKYHVVFYASENDETLAKYGLCDIAQKTTAFTYNELAHVVFVSNNLSYSEKLHRLLHEIGHIKLQHTGAGTLYLKNNDEIEAEAEAFVYAVLYRKRTVFPPILVGALIIISLLIGCAAGNLLSQGKTATQREFGVEETSPISDTVYVTPSGTKYHRADCHYTKDKETIAISRADAEKKYAPCAVCRP